MEAEVLEGHAARLEAKFWPVSAVLELELTPFEYQYLASLTPHYFANFLGSSTQKLVARTLH